ncbi:MAG: cupin domain-containing protein [Pirellulaceae bacterium]
MKVRSIESVPTQEVDMPGATGCQVQWLIGEKDGAPNFAMRRFMVAPGGHTPRHHHPYEHEVFVLSGHGEVIENDAPSSHRSPAM